jgi:uncharacterized C2H2 Zn-finger protein
MVKIIKHGDSKRVKCPRCGSILRFRGELWKLKN